MRVWLKKVIKGMYYSDKLSSLVEDLDLLEEEIELKKEELKLLTKNPSIHCLRAMIAELYLAGFELGELKIILSNEAYHNLVNIFKEIEKKFDGVIFDGVKVVVDERIAGYYVGAYK